MWVRQPSILRKQSKSKQDRKIVWICHSLGGLVLKQVCLHDIWCFKASRALTLNTGLNRGQDTPSLQLDQRLNSRYCLYGDSTSWLWHGRPWNYCVDGGRFGSPGQPHLQSGYPEGSQKEQQHPLWYIQSVLQHLFRHDHPLFPRDDTSWPCNSKSQ